MTQICFSAPSNLDAIDDMLDRLVPFMMDLHPHVVQNSVAEGRELVVPGEATCSDAAPYLQGEIMHQ